MTALLGLLRPLEWVNATLLRFGRGVGVVLIALMVTAILIQVFFRYVLNNALPWPDEFARFCMLWMTGLMAPTAYRRGGFVAIDILERAIPRGAAAALALILLAIAGMVLIIAVQIGWGEINGFGAKFKTASLYYPTFDGWEKMPRRFMFASLLVGVVLLLMVNVELILRNLITLMGGGDRLTVLEEPDMVTE